MTTEPRKSGDPMRIGIDERSQSDRFRSDPESDSESGSDFAEGNLR
jgi:hypothetical protein